MNADVEKAVEILGQFVRGERNALGNTWGVEMAASKLVEVTRVLRDQEAEIAALERHRSHEHIVAENALALLRDCNAVALKRGDKYGLCDAIDNTGQPYQSEHLATHLGGENA